MVQLYSLMWILAAFGALIGFLRGWNRELVATAGILLGTFALFQLDSILRGTLLLSFPPAQAFAIQILIFFVIVYLAYQNSFFETGDDRDQTQFQTSILGTMVGAINGYLLGGAIWYFMDINEYPLYPAIVAPGPASPSAENLNMIPIVILSGGTSGGGELLLIGLFVLFLLVLAIL